jgi:cytochrome c peroxidase
MLGRIRDDNDKKFAKKGGPEPELAININDSELGNLGLTQNEEKAIVAILKTLTNDYPE